jgi:hypothetical protein
VRLLPPHQGRVGCGRSRWAEEDRAGAIAVSSVLDTALTCGFRRRRRAWQNQDVLTLRRTRRPLAIICVAVIVLAVLAPGVAGVDLAPPAVEYVLLPQLEPFETVAAARGPDTQLIALRTALPGRAPPVSF